MENRLVLAWDSESWEEGWRCSYKRVAQGDPYRSGGVQHPGLNMGLNISTGMVKWYRRVYTHITPMSISWI